MLEALRQRIATGLQHLSVRLTRAGTVESLPRHECPVLIFFHGYSLAHTIRPLVVGRALRGRGYPVEFAGVGPHADRITAEGFQVYPVETMPQSRMDEYVARSDYGYYNAEWIDRCVQAERALIRQLRPALALADLRPTLRLTASLEGVYIALIEAAYNQPGYPFPIRLPTAFSLGTEPFDEYARGNVSTFKPHHTLRLVADVPQFHPPGEVTPSHYRYVGPLIESPPLRPIAALGDWDDSLPLIYFNCGSTGGHPGFLDAVLHRMANKSYRVLVTTAGRWSGPIEASNIRVVDFVPAAWVLARAALFVGIGGIGSIYHALRQEVPVLGAPEHLDQEYHLNRVRDLGLGYKLNWDAFLRVDPLLEAIDDLLTHRDEFALRCRALATHIGEWDGGEAAADVVDAFFIDQRSVHQVEAVYRIPESEFLHYLNLSTPANLGVEELRPLLHRNLSRGLPHVRQGSQIVFDRADSWNWLYDHEPVFFESDYRALEAKRRDFFHPVNGHIALHRNRQRYSLTYTYRLYPSTLPSDIRARLFLPYPIPSPHQGDIELCAWAPDDLRTCFAPQAGFFYGYPIQAEDNAPASIDFSYTCELTVQGRMEPTAPASLSACESRRYSEIDPELAQEAVVQNFFAELDLDGIEDPLEKARRIYAQLAETKRFKKTKEPSQDLASSIHVVLNDNGGHCITLSNAFIALCRLQGIAAREVTGALAGYPAGAGRFAMAVHNEMLFGHTWAEVFAPGRGWVPVEFHGIVIGPQAATEDNVADETLRRHIAEVGGRYVDFYFGQKVVRLRPNEGRCRARNRGVEAVAGEFVAFLDGDALPHPQWLQCHIEALEQGGPESLLCGAEYSLPDLEYLHDPQNGMPMENKTPSVVREYVRVHRQELILTEDMVLGAFDRIEDRAVLGGYPFPELETLQEQIAELFAQHPDSPIGWLGFFPHNGMVAKEAFLAVGGFDPAMAFSEGWDLAYRLQQSGCRPCFVPEAKTYHLYHYHDFSDPIKAYKETLVPKRAMQYMERKHGDPKLLLFHFWHASIWPDPFLPEEVLLGDLVEFHHAYTHGSTSRLRELQILLDHHPLWAELSEARIP